MTELHIAAINKTLTAPDKAGRLDTFLTGVMPEYTRSRIQSLIKNGSITVNGNTVKAGFELAGGESISLTIPELKALAVTEENIPLNVLYEDKDIIVIDKPQGMVVHPAAGHFKGTLVNALLYHCQDLSGINGIIRPGIVHRIDKDTSGILVAAKNDEAHLGLSEQWHGHNIKRLYLALLHGIVSEPAGIIDAPIGRHPKDRKKMAVEPKNGRNAVTRYGVLERFRNYTLAELALETGRTHQIRVHMSYLGHPVVGDPTYGPKKNEFGLKGQALHAQVLGFKHPRTKEWLEFTSPIPTYFNEILEKLRRE